MALLRPAQILNPWPTDYHAHTSNFSDGFDTLRDMVVKAGEIGLESITFTDHSQFTLDAMRKKRGKIFGAGAWRVMITRWENDINNVPVYWGVEGDLKDDDGNICDYIESEDVPQGDFLILSVHHDAYEGNFKNITDAYIKALEKHHHKINLIGHPSFIKTSKHLDMERLCRAANAYHVPLEINGATMMTDRLDMDKLRIMLEHGNQFMVNSDAHITCELASARKFAFDFLHKEGYIALGEVGQQGTYRDIAHRHNWS